MGSAARIEDVARVAIYLDVIGHVERLPVLGQAGEQHRVRAGIHVEEAGVGRVQATRDERPVTAPRDAVDEDHRPTDHVSVHFRSQKEPRQFFRFGP